jgi:hypothetical protein
MRVAALAFGLTAAAGAVQWSAAQGREVRIVVATTIYAEPDSQTTLAIEVTPRETLPDNSFVRLRGFPRSVSLTEGHAIAPGSWAVPLDALGSLKAIVPAGIIGRNEIRISVVAADGTTLAESKTALVVAAAALVTPLPKPPAAPPPQRVAPAPPPASVARPPRRRELSAEERARAEALLARGEKHFDDGNIGAARMFFQRAAEVGLAAGALRMAATYDPLELARLKALVTPDRNEARKWYEQARDLGAQEEAEERLARLAGR